MAESKEHIYVIRLDEAVWDEAKFVKAGPPWPIREGV